MIIFDKDSSKWIMFSCYENTGKTLKYNILTKDVPPLKLGEIRWFGRWRQYAFYPEPDTVFEKQCMKDITAFLERLMAERKIAKI
jgi:hypothetical protein